MRGGSLGQRSQGGVSDVQVRKTLKGPFAKNK